MKSTITISVIISAATELGRQILSGVRTYCKEHPGMAIDLLSTDCSPAIVYNIRNNPLVASLPSTGKFQSMASFYPSMVSTSNRFAVENFPCVISNDVEVGRMGAEYLLSLGYRHLAFLSKSYFHFSKQRKNGFMEIAEKAGAKLHIFENCQKSEMAQVANDLLRMNEPIGLMASSDLFARWFIERVPNPTRVIPDRIAVLGVDDDPLENNLSPVSLSSIRLSGERIGYEAADLAVRIASGEKTSNGPILISPSRIVIRQSTSELAVQDKWTVKALNYMRENISTIGNVGDVVAALKINRRPLEMRFERLLGSTISHELTKVRIHRAKELIATTDISLKEIAYLVGYSEPRMLSIAFKRETCESPSDYRKRISPGR